ncbi:MAG: hypothetical protein JJU36_04305 [Phycisphaeraceae bacterium]|nr:hypothetical protein [Phycisphaeraceae bacterium]
MSQSVSSQGDVVVGKLLGQTPASGDRPAMMELGVPGTDYKLHLVEAAPARPDAFGQVRGRIVGQARRVDVVRTGGRFVEPVFGRPRRVQGRITARDLSANAITVFCGLPMTFRLSAGQKAGDMSEGWMVAFDVDRGTRFEPIED